MNEILTIVNPKTKIKPGNEKNVAWLTKIHTISDVYKNESAAFASNRDELFYFHFHFLDLSVAFSFISIIVRIESMKACVPVFFRLCDIFSEE